MHNKITGLPGALACVLAAAVPSAVAQSISEADFLAEMPVVLSVSRMAQPIDETPGAVTILDRQFIRMSGARDVVDLLRFVPGFQSTTSFETDAPLASYHGRSDDWANRIQVLVDGRSVYSTHLQGSAGLGWQTLALDDIERIEVLRGSNSATYGARAFLGVVNIVSRDARDTPGAALQLTLGENNVADLGVRLGWGDEQSQYRLSTDTRGDDGLRGAFGKNRVDRVNLSSHFGLAGNGDLDVRAGAVDIQFGRGTPGSAGNNARTSTMGTRFLQTDWRKQLNDAEDIAVSASHTEVYYRDSFPYLDASLDSHDLSGDISYVGIPIDFSGKEFNDAVSFQHTVRQSPAFRYVWGAEARQEQVVSKPTFDRREQVTSRFLRLFGSGEWRLSPDFIVNAGALAESSDIGGDSVSPRIMANWRVSEGHTLRVGASTAFRPPSAFEKYATVRYYDTNGLNPITTVENTGRAGTEKVLSQELGYNFGLPGSAFSADVRVFNEAVRDGVGVTKALEYKEALNGDNFRIQGLEYQIAWKPSAMTRVYFSQSWTGIHVDSLVDYSTKFRVEHGAPELSSALVATHEMANGLALTLSHQQIENTALMSDANRNLLFSMGRTDVRVARKFRLASTKAEWALTVQSLDGPIRDGDRKFFFYPRALLTLRFEN